MAAAIPWILKGVGVMASSKALSAATSKKPGAVQPKPAEPTIDEAARNTEEADRIKKRKGVLANVFGGSSSTGSPAVGTAKLLGG